MDSVAKHERTDRERRSIHVAPSLIPRDPRDTGLAGLYFAAVEAGRRTAAMAAVIPVANDGTRALKALLLGVVSVAAILLGLALIPAWSVRPARASMLLAQWRLHILAAGLSTLVAAALVLLIGTPQV